MLYKNLKFVSQTFNVDLVFSKTEWIHSWGYFLVA
jgi:hypothetical protein